jgi:hypothetical protein
MLCFFQPMVNALVSFKDINTIIIKASSEIDLNRCIEAIKQKLNELAPSKERRYIRVWNQSNVRKLRNTLDDRDMIADISAYLRGYYTEVPI